MNERLGNFLNRIYGKNVAVIGIGISNSPLIDFLLKHGAKVTAYDRKSREEIPELAEKFEEKGVRLVLGENYLDRIDGDLIFKTPGMRYDVPALVSARERGIEVTSEIEVLFDVCPGKIIAVTGSDGKTTTTTLIHKFLETGGYKTRLGGNIGKPLLPECEDMTADEYIVLELSSFQLHTLRKSPDVAVITNITPNHLDWHTDYAEYIDAKKNIMKHQDKDGLLVTNAKNDETKKLISDANGKVRTFSAYTDADISLKDGIICLGEEKLLDTSDIKVMGMHNVENFMTAIGAVYDIVDKRVFTEVARSFNGVQHRIEFVREIDGVRYYNSSIDSSPNRSINTLNVFGDNVVMIAGGKDKGIPYDEIGPSVCEHVKTLVLIGKTSDKIEDAVKDCDKEGKVKILRATTYPEAVSLAKENASAGDVVLLSPASTSFDMFANFEERGNLFKKLVQEL